MNIIGLIFLKRQFSDHVLLFMKSPWESPNLCLDPIRFNNIFLPTISNILRKMSFGKYNVIYLTALQRLRQLPVGPAVIWPMVTTHLSPLNFLTFTSPDPIRRCECVL